MKEENNRLLSKITEECQDEEVLEEQAPDEDVFTR